MSYKTLGKITYIAAVLIIGGYFYFLPKDNSFIVKGFPEHQEKDSTHLNSSNSTLQQEDKGSLPTETHSEVKELVSLPEDLLKPTAFESVFWASSHTCFSKECAAVKEFMISTCEPIADEIIDNHGIKISVLKRDSLDRKASICIHKSQELLAFERVAIYKSKDIFTIVSFLDELPFKEGEGVLILKRLGFDYVNYRLSKKNSPDDFWAAYAYGLDPENLRVRTEVVKQEDIDCHKIVLFWKKEPVDERVECSLI